MGNPTLIPSPGLPPSDGSERRWNERTGWRPSHEAPPSAYFRFSPILGTMVEATWAKGFSAGDEFEGARLFTAAEVDHQEGEWVFRAYEGHAGLALDAMHRHRNLCVEAARKELRRIGPEAFLAKVSERIAEREASRGR